MALLRNDALRNHPYLRRHPSDQRSWSDFIRALNEQSIGAIGAISGGIEIVSSLPTLPDTNYPEGSVVFLSTDDKLYRNTDGSTWSKAVDGGDITANTIVGNAIVAGEITAAKLEATLTFTNELVISSSGQIRQGQTAYDTGTGFWLGDDSGTAKFSIGNSAGNKLTWDGSALSITGSANLTNTAQTFTPGWETSFTVAPTGDISYVDLGPFVVMWVDSAMTGTSDGVDPTFIGSGIPSAIRPTTSRAVHCMIINSNVPESGSVNIQSNGNFSVRRHATSSGFPAPQVSAFDHTNSKGLPAGWIVMYGK